MKMKAVLNNRLKLKGTQRGVGLIEVLIALVVFALGVVGMAGLQLRTMSVTMDSTQRSYVIAKSQDIADRIRGSGIAASEYLDTYSQADDFCDTNVATSCADTSEADANICTIDQMVAFDLYDAFCEGADDDYESTGSLETQVADWQVDISCEFPDGGGMTATTTCDELGAQVIVETSWFARSFDEDTTVDEPRRDSMTLRFVP